jgi:hypothetical protein
MREKIIAFHPEISRELESIAAAIFYQQIRYWSDKGNLDNGWIYKTSKEFEEETSLTEKQQRSCREILVKKGWVKIEKRMVQRSSVWHYKLLVDFHLEFTTTGETPSDNRPKGNSQPAKGQLSGSQKASSTIHRLHTESTTESIGASAHTPKLSNSLFFEEVKNWKKGNPLAEPVTDELKFFVDTTGLTKNEVWNEVQKFVLYWTEKNPTGKKERWELERTFEVRRRLLTWFTRAFASVKTNIKNNKPKFI